jgi:hypothetical protein
MKEFHIAAGLLSLVAGFLAMAATKGSPLHRQAGQFFVVGMLMMTLSAATMAIVLQANPQPLVNAMNGTAALLTFYLVCTSFLTVRFRVAEVRGVLTGFAVLATVVASFALVIAGLGLTNTLGRPGVMTAYPLLMFGLVGAIGAGLDLRLMRAGEITGKHRLARHLWRMGFALWIATASFFFGQLKWFPPGYRKMQYAAIPVLGVMILLIYWLVRTLRGRRAAAPSITRPS